jgi:uncharacterized protein YxjI
MTHGQNALQNLYTSVLDFRILNTGSLSAHVNAFEYNFKILHQRHVCTCYLKKNFKLNVDTYVFYVYCTVHCNIIIIYRAFHNVLHDYKHL